MIVVKHLIARGNNSSILCLNLSRGFSPGSSVFSDRES